MRTDLLHQDQVKYLIKIYSDKPFKTIFLLLKGTVGVLFFSHISDFQGIPLNFVVF